MIIGKIGDYEIEYLEIQQTQAWWTQLPQHSWLLLALVGETDKALFTQVTAECMKYPPLGICCAGPSAHLLEDWFDEEIVLAAVAREEQEQMEHEGTIVTTADIDVDEGFWFAVTLTPDLAAAAAKTILCLDLTGKHQARLRELIPLINSGWLPPDSPND